MESNQKKIDHLIDHLEVLLNKQEQFSHDIQELKKEIFKLQAEIEKDNASKTFVASDIVKETKFTAETKTEIISEEKESSKVKSTLVNKAPSSAFEVKSSLERFIGENLISKIGIVITIIGVAIGARYAIENQYVNPLTRIILGYLFGIGLLGFALNLKKEYENFSSVLLSGSMAILYFITFFAYNFYNLFPQGITFVIMLLITALTVASALKYNKQVIAHIGLVGAYAIPFLTSDGSGNIEILFSYIALINIGILAISIKRYWKEVYYSSFSVTWLIFLVWMMVKYKQSEHFHIALGFVAVFFAIFYLTFLIFKLVQKEKFNLSDIFLLLSNSFIFYFFGYALLSENSLYSNSLGIFTLGNAAIHAIACVVVYSKKLTDRNLFYFVLGLALVFITIAIPVQFDGNWVTLIWVGEAAVLFWIGRTRGVDFYEKLSYPLMSLAFISICHDWSTSYSGYITSMPETRITPILNLSFLSSALTIAAFGFINFINNSKKYTEAKFRSEGINTITSFIVPAFLVITVYFGFLLEIITYWNQLYADSFVETSSSLEEFGTHIMNKNLPMFKTIWVINYSLLFCSISTFYVAYRVKNLSTNKLVFSLNTIATLALLTIGLYLFSELRENYLEKINAEYYSVELISIGIRYISFALAAILVVASYKAIRKNDLQVKYSVALDLMLHASILWVASSELISWMDIAQSTQSYKLGLSILWGVYSLFLIVLGLWKKKKHLRIGAISLFGITLVKLFLYDIAHLETIPKTIVLVSLGMLLLIISFLYNKYKHIIIEEEEN